MIVKLLGFAPDADQTIVGVITNCSGVVPSLKGMKGAPTPVSAGLATLDATCQGAAVLAKIDATTRFFAGTATKIQEAGASTWANVSATVYTTAQTARWRFAQQGNVALAVNAADTLQASVSSGNFTTLAGMPIGAIVEVVNQFVFVLNTTSSADQWRCSALGDYTSWTTSAATQATSGRLTDSPGPITAAKRFGNALLVFKRDSMYIGVYSGPPIVWDFTQIPGDVGALSQEAVANIGTSENPKLIFMGSNDFYLYDGSKPIPIGTNRVKLKVFTELQQGRFYACCAMHDRVNSLVYFYYPVADSVLPDHCVVYNYRTDKWGADVERRIEIPVEFVGSGVTYDALGALYATYADFPTTSYDLAFLSSSAKVPAFFDSTHSVKTLTGMAGTTSLTTGDIGDDSQFLTLSRVRPKYLVKPTSASLTNFYRNNVGDALTTDATTPLSSRNTFDVIRDARWHRFQIDQVGDWEMPGFTPEGVEGGLE